MGGFLKILLTRPFDLRRAEDARNFVRLTDPHYAQDDDHWRDSHTAPSRGATPRRVA